MKRFTKKLCFSLLLLSLNIGISLAKEDPDIYTTKSCDVNTQAAIMNEAKDVMVTYEDIYENTYEAYDDYLEDESVDSKRYVNLKIYNLGPSIAIKIVNETTGSTITAEGVNLFSYKNARDGVITVKKLASPHINNYRITVHGLNECQGKTFRTIRYTLPALNPYSDFEVCQDVPEFYLCQPLITTPISNSIDIPKAVREYKDKLEEEGAREEEKKSNTPKISRLISNTSKQKIGFVIVLLTIGFGITIFILYKRKNGAK